MKTQYFVSRQCQTRENNPAENIRAGIEYFRNHEAYVLLGDPGSGKSCLFKQEAVNTENGVYLSARDFIDFDCEEWKGKTLFIDGLDEVRAGRDDPQTPLGAIRSKLDKLKIAKFRLSCRAADWHGNSDAEAIKACTPNGEITILYLQPLDIAQVRDILAHDERVKDVDKFLENANRFGVEGLLDNPQTLTMLVASVEAGEWPTSKSKVYELATRKLVVDHRGSALPIYPIPRMLEAAGWLSALQLLANEPVIHQGYAERDGIPLSDVAIDDFEISKFVLGTRLFTQVKDAQYSYIHRSVAEYLAASFIAERIRQGLPFGRILAISSGFDGGVVASLRGLMGWLGAISAEARNRLIELDPLGMVIYGDTQLFSIETKKLLLNKLTKHIERTREISPHANPQGFSALTTQDMVHSLQALFSESSRSRPHENVLNCLLEGMRHTKLVGLNQVLLDIVRDPTHFQGVRVSALNALIYQNPDDNQVLLSLAEDLRLNHIQDEGQRMLGILLHQLYPRLIPPSKILQYLHRKIDDDNHVTRYDSFWGHDLPERVADSDVPSMLDELSEIELPTTRGQYKDWYLQRLAENLLVRGIRIYGEQIIPERLYRWLSIGMDEFDNSHLDKAIQSEIAEWLSDRPVLYLALLKTGIYSVEDSIDVRNRIYRAFRHLYDADMPKNIGAWWLELALMEPEKEMREEFFSRSFLQLVYAKGANTNQILQQFDEFVTKHREFEEAYQRLIYCEFSQDNWQQKLALQNKEFAEQHAAEEEAKMNFLRQNIEAISEGKAYPQTYFNLASVCYQHYSNEKSGDERLVEYLNNDNALIHATKTGLLKILDRDDLPSVADIFELALKDRQHYIRLPFLLCLEKRYEMSPESLTFLSDDQVERALAFWYTYGAGNEPAWVGKLISVKPDLAADLYKNYVRTMLAGKKQVVTGVYALARNPLYEPIARKITMELLEAHPVRSAKGQIETLEYLLKAAIAYSDKTQLKQWLHKRLSLKGLDVAQRTYLITTGFIISPDEYIPIVRKQVAGNVIRINHLSYFLYSGWDNNASYKFSIEGMGLIIQLLGPRCSPEWKTGANWVGRADNERDFVRSLIHQLESSTEESSSQVLSYLFNLSVLADWQDMIREAIQNQQINRREALFKHPNVQQVVDVLKNLRPANVSDLAALTIEFLDELDMELRANDTDSYKQFWNVDSNNRPVSPRPENGCRDYLASRLRERFLPYEVSVLPETREADSKRADLRMAYRSHGNTFNLPVEIKLDHSRDLWRAIHEQLIPQYTLEADTGGRGILIVIWFNDSTKRISSPPTGTKPKTASELKDKLKALLSPKESSLIDIVVLDVSRSSGKR